MSNSASRAMENWALDDWLVFIQKQHHRSIDLDLQRVGRVWKKLQGAHSNSNSKIVIAVAGTNGKGSCVAMLSAVLQDAGLTVGSYTSPHLVRYNERICFNDKEMDDETLCQAFVEIEHVRAEIPLTYFEFGTLCALSVFAKQQVDASVLEVGMGGRLDAVNLVENDIALITSIGLDHTHWLGDNRECIATEKAGIFKQNAFAVCADCEPPQNIARIATEQQCTLLQNKQDYQVELTDKGISWSSQHPAIAPDWQSITQLKLPISGAQQINNLGGVVATLALSSKQTGVTPKNLLHGLAKTKLLGRCQVIHDSPETIIDVAHNHDSAAELADFLSQRKMATSSKTYGIFGALEDKSVAKIIEAMDDVIDHWYFATLANGGHSAETLKKYFTELGSSSVAKCYDSPVIAYLAAVAEAKTDDRIAVFGSFHMAGAIFSHLEQSPKRKA